MVINHQLWKERLGGAPDIIGRTIQLNNTMFTVVGVTAAGFVGLERTVRTDVWVTTAQAPFVVPGLRGELTDRNHRWFQVVGRLADGASIDQARAQLDLLVARWQAGDARSYARARLGVTPQEEATRQGTRQGTIFLALVALVLLIACANVANLTLARGEARRREMALRAALGASRWVLMRQMLLESALVSLAATTIAVLLAAWLIRLIPALLPPGASMMTLDVRVDGRLLTFAGVLAALSTALVGLVPAWRGSRADIVSGLKTQPSTTTWGGRALQLRDVLVIGEIALSGVVLIAAGLLVRSFTQSLAVNPGFDTHKEVATFYVVPGPKGYNRAATYRFFEAARENIGTVPGVTRVSYGIRLPAQGNEAGWSAEFTVPGKQPPPGDDMFKIRYTMVGPDYFPLMGTKILRGRGIGVEDKPDALPVAVISDSMARSLWSGENPVGRHIRMGRERPVDREIVGVAEDIRISGLYEPPEMYVYVPFAQNQPSFAMLLVETTGDASGIIAPVRRRIAEIDP
ncbi:MAG TPA: ABC transporter permease, partial [Coriobacteriia bacterium]